MESQGDTVLVVVDANRGGKGGMEAVNWALKHIVRPRDTVIALGVILESCSKKISCFPFLMRIGISGLWERLDFPGQGEVDPEELELEIEKKRGQYQSNLQPYYRQCLKNEVKMEVKFAAGICPTRLTVQEAQNSNAHRVVLDSHLKKYTEYIRLRISGNLLVHVKEKDIAVLVPLKASGKDIPEEESSAPLPVTESSCSYPLSNWRGSPRAIDQSELEAITNNFADENIIGEANGMKYYHGMLQDAPVLVECFIETDENFWSMLEILSRVRHRNILNIVGYLSTGAPKSLLYDYMFMGTVDLNLQCKKNFSY